VFGNAIAVPGVPHNQYVNYLMPGVFTQTVVFGSITTGVALAEDLQKGLIERFQSLPMARSAVLAGRTMADLVRNAFVLLLMVAVGFAVGWRVHTTIPQTIAGLLIMLLFAHSAAQAAAFPIIAPLVFASTAFVAAATMPGPLKWFANHQPVSIVIDGVRSLTYGGTFANAGKVLAALVWCVGIIVVTAPLAVRIYRRKV
jgi:ABC-2 type transport system permease protein